MFKKTPNPSDFCFLDSNQENRLSSFERLTLTGGDELKRALTWAARQFEGLKKDQLDSKLGPEALQAALDFYAQPIWQEQAGKFFIKPSPVEVKSAEVHGLEDGEIIDLSFASMYQPQNPKFKEFYKQRTELHTVHARFWKHKAEDAACVIAIHGWSMGDQRINSLAFLPGILYQLGLNVALIELPYHGRRALKGADLQAQSFVPGTRVLEFNEAMLQVISDLRQLRMHLTAKGQAKIGWTGMSLGAYIGALWSGLDALDFAVPFVPLVSMSELAWQVLRSKHQTKELRKLGFSMENLEAVYHFHSPLAHTLQIPADKIFILAGISDEMIPARQVKLLWEHWGRPRLRWYKGGHTAQFKGSKALSEALEFIRQIGRESSV